MSKKRIVSAKAGVVFVLSLLVAAATVLSSGASAIQDMDSNPSNPNTASAAMLVEVKQADTSWGELDITPVQPAAAQPSADVLMALQQVEEDDGFVYCPTISLSEELQQYTYDKCQEHGLNYTVVLALMWRESRFNASAVGYNSNGTRDNGLMQINDVNKSWLQKEYGITNLMDPYQNIDAGTAMLGAMVAKYGDHDALMAYQYGEAGMKVKQSQGITTNNQIQQLYVKSEEFQELLVYYDDAA